jgi:hypothetical protein
MKKILSISAHFVSFFFFLFVITACNESNPLPTAQLTLEFDNVVGNKNLVLNGAASTNASGEDLIITKFNYYVSNIKLLKPDGSSYTVPQDSSYFLIMEDKKESQFVTLKNVPLGDYSGVQFMVGVDSLRSASPIDKRKGVLDPGSSLMEDAMYWAWNSGYIFVKLEGTSSKSTAANGKFYYHIGLFGGIDTKTVNNTRTVKVDFGTQRASVKTTEAPEVHLLVDALKVFDGPGTSLSIAGFNTVMGAQQPKSAEIANNYAAMFTLDHIHN